MQSQDLAFFTSLVQAILLAILPVFAGMIVRWVMVTIETERVKLDSKTLDNLTWLTGVAVKAAEQSKAAGYIADKKAYALEFCQAWLDNHNMKLDVKTLEGAIEAAVLSEFNRGKGETKKLPSLAAQE